MSSLNSGPAHSNLYLLAELEETQVEAESLS